MQKIVRWVVDCLVGLFTIIAAYYIFLLVYHLSDVMHYLYSSVSAVESSYPLLLILKYVFIALVLLGLHILLTIWMYADFARRKFTSDTQRTFWLAILVAGLSPVYYFAVGRNEKN